MLYHTLLDMKYGFGIALTPRNLIWSVFGVVLGNFVGVLPGMGPLTTIAILLPLTYTMHAVPAMMMLSGIFYGAIYGGAIGAILLNLPVHSAHAVTCLDGYPLTKKGRGGAALGIAMMSSFFGASFGIIMMIFLSPILVDVAFKFGPAELSSVMLLGLLSGSTMAGRSPIKGIAMTLFGILCGTVGTDVNTGFIRYSFGFSELQSGLDLIALAMGLFGVAEFLRNVNHTIPSPLKQKIRLRDMRPTRAEVKQSFFPMLRGTLVGALFGALPGTGPTITTFVSYALERKISRTPERFGQGALEGVASAESSAHSKTQMDFIPTLCLGIPGDPVMALLLGALIIQGVNPGPQLITDHPEIFWGLIASFWVGNALLMLLNIPLIGVWVKLLELPYRYLVPSALFFISVGVFASQNSFFQVWEVLGFGVVGWIFLYFDFPLTPIILGFILGPMLETHFRRTLLLSRGNMAVFIQAPISRWIVIACVIMLSTQFLAYLRAKKTR